LDSTLGQWTPTTVTPTSGTNYGTASMALTNVPYGRHVLYAFAAYGDEVSRDHGPGGLGTQGQTPVIGNPECSSLGAECNAPSATGQSYEPFVPYVFVEVPQATQLTLTSLPNASTYNNGVSVVFTATLTVTTTCDHPAFPTGETIYFYYDGTLEGTGTLNASGVATLTLSSTALPKGSDLVVAFYAGDANYASSSGPDTQVVN
jgi:hypothetical protein